jgi:hypothetical protein
MQEQCQLAYWYEVKIEKLRLEMVKIKKKDSLCIVWTCGWNSSGVLLVRSLLLNLLIPIDMIKCIVDSQGVHKGK